jgi:transcriptional regulator with XRE-family HTH domain
MKKPAYILYMNLGENIRLLRKEAGLTQVQMAKLLNMSQQVITNYERGVARPDTKNLPEIAKVLGVNIDALFDPEQRKFKKSAQDGPRKGSRLSKIQHIYNKLTPSEQRLVLKQVESLAPSEQ